MNAIFHFENHIATAMAFQEKHLEPKLNQAGLLNQTQIIFQDFVDRGGIGAPVLAPDQVSLQASDKWDSISPKPGKTVWVMDLCGYGSSHTADSSYGLRVLLGLATQFGLQIHNFLESPSFLFIILTRFPDHLREKDGIARLTNPRFNVSELAKIWPQIRQIINENHIHKTPVSMDATLASIYRNGPKIVFANGAMDEAWLAELIVAWLQK